MKFLIMFRCNANRLIIEYYSVKPQLLWVNFILFSFEIIIGLINGAGSVHKIVKFLSENLLLGNFYLDYTNAVH